ncbi:MAG TPA: GNAT family N-acetyltransferase [Gaiellaceae bacterium]|nr:GNAT family N-acetyltransferase [Gaiellaceae bacterium]
MIRAATSDDLPLVRELWRAFSEEIPEPSWHDSDLEEDVEWLAEAVAKETVLLADDVGLAVALMKGERHGFLDMLYVRPAARGTGVSRELTREAAARLRARGAEVLELEVLATNANARALYERWGFQTSELTLAAPIDALERRLGERSAGPTLGTLHVQTDDRGSVEKIVAKTLPRLGKSASTDVGEPLNGWVAIRDELCSREPRHLKAMAKELSYSLAAVVLALGIEEGAVVRYNLYDRGSVVDEYVSVPEYFGELPPGDVIALGANPTVVARLTGADPKHVREVARTAASVAELPPAQELYEQIADLMGVSV